MRKKTQKTRLRSIYNPYEWLPGYGESAIRISTSADCRSLEVTVYYDSKEDRNIEVFRVLNFSESCDFRFRRFPGPAGLGRDVKHAAEQVKYDKPVHRAGDLFEVVNSESALSWSTYAKHRICRHFSIYFMYENQKLDVISDSVTLSDEFVSNRLRN